MGFLIRIYSAELKMFFTISVTAKRTRLWSGAAGFWTSDLTAEFCFCAAVETINSTQLVGRDQRVGHGAVWIGSRLHVYLPSVQGPLDPRSHSLQRLLEGLRTPRSVWLQCYCPHHTVQTVTTAASPLLLCPAGEHITGPTAGHLSAKRPIAEELAGGPSRRRHQGPDVSVAVVALSSSAPPLLAAPLRLPHHPHRVFHSAVD